MSYSSEVLADSPVVYYRLGDTSGTSMVDASGNGRTGAYVNAPTKGVTGALTGDTDTAVTFARASSQYATFPTTGLPSGASAHTLEAWVKPNSISDSQGIMSIGNFGSGGQSNALRLGGSSSAPQIVYYWWGNDVVINVPAALLPVGQWAHIVVTYDGTFRRAYVNGESVGGDTPNPPNVVVTSPTIGRAQSSELFDGSIDEVAVYSTALTRTRIRAHYAAGVAASVPQNYREAVLNDMPIGYWRLGEASGNPVDTSGWWTSTVTGTIARVSGLLVGDSDGAFDFNGTSNQVDLARNPLPTNQSLSVEALISLDGNGKLQSIFGRADEGSGNVLFKLVVSASNLLQFVVKRGGVTYTATGTTALAVGTTYHVVGVFDATAGTVKAYVNGTLEATVTGVTGSWSGTPSALMGAGYNGAIYARFDGKLDEVAYYGSALSAARISTHYALATGAATATTGAVSAVASAPTVTVAGTVITTGQVAAAASSPTVAVAGVLPTTGSVAAVAASPTVTVAGEIAGVTAGVVAATAGSPVVAVDGDVPTPISGSVMAVAGSPMVRVNDAPPSAPAEFETSSALDVAPLIDMAGLLTAAEFTATSTLDVGIFYNIQAFAGVDFTADTWSRVLDDYDVAVDPVTRRPQYKLVAVDMAGTPIAELDSAVMGSATRSLNGRGGFAFRLGKNDPKLPLVPQFAEVQLWRGRNLVPGGWFVVTDPSLGDGDDSFDYQCAGLAWHFEARLVGKERPELLRNGGFEQGSKYWGFSYSPGSNAEAPPKWEITDEACEGGKALRVFAEDKVVEFKRTVETQGVFVANSSTFLSGGEQFIRDAIADIPQKQAVTIEGHTADADGGTGYALSVARAEAAVSVAHAARPDLILTAVGKGETEQVASNATEDGRRKNRRVVIRANFTATKVGHRQFVGQIFTYTNDTDEPLDIDVQAQGRIDTWGGPSKDGWMLYADVRTIAAKPKILNNGYTNVDEFTVRNRWVPLHTTVTVPANTTASVNVRGYPTAGASSFDQFSAMPNLKLTFNQKDPQQVISGLVAHAQDPAYGKSDLNIQGFGNWSGFKIDRSYPWKDHIRVSDAIDEVVRSLNGPDANMLVTARRRWLVVAPKQGHETGVVLAAGDRIGDARIISYESGVDGDEVATTAIVQSSWSGGGMSEVITRKPRSDGKVFERLYQAEQDAPVSTLKEQAGTAVEYGRAGLITRVTIHPDDTSFLMSRVTIGDVVTVDVHDSQVQVRADHRIIQIDLDPTRDQYTYTLAPKE